MNSIAVSSIVFACVFGGALFGIVLRTVLPEQHLRDESKDVVKLGMGLVGTMAALVLGLLIASAKTSFDAQSNELTEMSSKVVLLDRILAHYGPEAKEARDALRGTVVHNLDQMWPKESTISHEMVAPSVSNEILLEKVVGLTPKDEAQRLIQSQALGIMINLGQTRWLMYEQQATAVSMPLLVVLVFWIAAIFVSFGLFSPSNPTVIVSLFVSAFSVSCAIFLILEMYSPYGGLIRISSAPLRAAVAHLGM
jgi:hypothetical protein